MSNIFITDIVGTIGIPGTDAQLATATATLDGLLSGVANLTYDRALAWVEDQGGPFEVSSPRVIWRRDDDSKTIHTGLHG